MTDSELVLVTSARWRAMVARVVMISLFRVPRPAVAGRGLATRRRLGGTPNRLEWGVLAKGVERGRARGGHCMQDGALRGVQRTDHHAVANVDANVGTAVLHDQVAGSGSRRGLH